MKVHGSNHISLHGCKNQHIYDMIEYSLDISSKVKIATICMLNVVIVKSYIAY